MAQQQQYICRSRNLAGCTLPALVQRREGVARQGEEEGNVMVLVVADEVVGRYVSAFGEEGEDLVQGEKLEATGDFMAND